MYERTHRLTNQKKKKQSDQNVAWRDNWLNTHISMHIKSFLLLFVCVSFVYLFRSLLLRERITFTVCMQIASFGKQINIPSVKMSAINIFTWRRKIAITFIIVIILCSHRTHKQTMNAGMPIQRLFFFSKCYACALFDDSRFLCVHAFACVCLQHDKQNDSIDDHRHQFYCAITLHVAHETKERTCNQVIKTVTFEWQLKCTNKIAIKLKSMERKSIWI